MMDDEDEVDNEPEKDDVNQDNDNVHQDNDDVNQDKDDVNQYKDDVNQYKDHVKQDNDNVHQDNREEDDGMYTCTVANAHGSINHTIKVGLLLLLLSLLSSLSLSLLLPGPEHKQRMPPWKAFYHERTARKPHRPGWLQFDPALRIDGEDGGGDCDGGGGDCDDLQDSNGNHRRWGT